MTRIPATENLLAALVILHLLVTAAHVMAHVLAQVTLSRQARCGGLILPQHI
jgi:hypothetical protein